MPQLPGHLANRYIGYKTDGRFVEVGAFNGISWSQTYPLAKLGWQGLMFEPNPKFFKDCVENHKLHDVKVVNIAISDRNGKSKLYLGGSLSTIKHEMIAVYNSMDWSRVARLNEEKFIIVPTLTLDTALKQYDWKPGFDYLIVDVEGSEIEVLKGFDLKFWHPTLLLIETSEKHENPRLNWRFDVITEMITKHGYTHVWGDKVNSAYVRETTET